MKASARREKILGMLKKSSEPVSANLLADKLKVSRQIIVGDVALLRAAGHDITATPRGYTLSEERASFNYVGTVVCRHTNDQLLDELYTIVDFGGYVIDVSVEHTIYGQLTGQLNVGSRYDADNFYQSVVDDGNKPLSNITGGIHIHHIGCNSEQNFAIIKERLQEKGYIFDEESEHFAEAAS